MFLGHIKDKEVELLMGYKGKKKGKPTLFVTCVILCLAAVFVSVTVLRRGQKTDRDPYSEQVGNTFYYDPITDLALLDLQTIPEYAGEPYVEINGNIPYFTEIEKKNRKAFESYSQLDPLGRCGRAYANVCAETRPTEERGEIGAVRPSGWHTVKYNDLIDGNYLYNRCHLIAYQLAGENANAKNLITGTRYLNTVGMLPFEKSVMRYLDSKDNHVLYRVTPIFEGENLVASEVEMEAWSVEDAGAGICFHVYCYNVQPGVLIDYAMGESSVEKVEDVSGGTSGNTAVENSGNASENSAGTDAGKNEQEVDFILNTNSHLIHLPDCSSVSAMAQHNKKEYRGTIAELVELGYQPCKRCLKNN